MPLRLGRGPRRPYEDNDGTCRIECEEDVDGEGVGGGPASVDGQGDQAADGQCGAQTDDRPLQAKRFILGGCLEQPTRGAQH